jgi:CBS domain-containing protein
MLVQDLMSRAVRTCSPRDTLERPAQSMWDSDIGAVPVVNDGNRVVGMLTDRDICMAAYTQGQPLHTIRVDRAMARHVVSCRPDDEIATAQKLMQCHQVRRLPVVDRQGRLVGVLSLNDLARAAASVTWDGQIGSEEVVATLAGVCAPRVPARPPVPPAKAPAAAIRVAAVARSRTLPAGV